MVFSIFLYVPRLIHLIENQACKLYLSIYDVGGSHIVINFKWIWG